MKLSALVLLGLAGLASANNQVPTFTWLQDKFSPDGIPLLSINFHDGNPNDVAILKQVNPLPKQPDETEESIDKCIFAGNLRDEPDVYVTLTGGCPFDDHFEIKVRSKRLHEFMFKVSENAARVVPSIYKIKGLVNDIALTPPMAKKLIERKIAAEGPKESYSLNVAMNYDFTFSSGFGGDEYNTIRRVVNHAQELYYHSTLTHDFTWNIGGSKQIPMYIEATEDYLRQVGAYNEPDYNTNVYMAYQNSAGGTVGIAWVGTICSEMSYKTAVCEWFNTDLNSGEILAHEVGHNLGMNHDFTGSPGNPRYDSQGRLCTNIGGVMDYYQTVTQWSTCSVEDFANTPHHCLNKK